jgi:hypothetical protein
MGVFAGTGIHPPPNSRQKRRNKPRLSPRDLAEHELAAGTITETELRRRQDRARRRECSSTWSDDVWNGHDRDYPAERATGKPGARIYTGSGSRKVKCCACGRGTPPQNCHGGKCDDCKLEAGSEWFLEHLPGSNHRKLIGGE